MVQKQAGTPPSGSAGTPSAPQQGATPPPPAPPKKSNTGLIVTIVIVVVIVVVGIILAIYFGSRFVADRGEQLVEQAIEGQTGAEVDLEQDEGTVKIETEEGSAEFGLGAELPADFPSDVPIYPGAQVISSLSLGPNRASVSLQSSDNYADVVAFYEAGIPAEGWNVESRNEFTADSGRSVILNATKGNRTVIVSVTEDTADNLVGISLTTSESE
jgi:hypothetical protein